MFTTRKFELTEEEYEKIKKWAETHECNCMGKSCVGGEISVTFTPTSIGTVIEAECACGDKVVIEDL